MKKFLPSFLIALVLLTVGNNFVLADGVNVNLTVKNNGDIVYSGSIALPPAGNISINDSDGTPHDTNADSVLSIINTADLLSTNFNISNLIYYSSFGAFYLKCINVSGSDLCDGWQYKVNDVNPSNGMDSEILSGGENVVLYFGDENKTPAPEPVHSNGGSGGFMALNLNSTLPVPSVSNPPATIAPISTPSVSTPVPTTTTPAPTPTPASINTILEEKPKPARNAESYANAGGEEILQKQSAGNSLKIVPKKSKKPDLKKAPVITEIKTIPEHKTIETQEPVKKSWFKNLLDKIFSIF